MKPSNGNAWINAVASSPYAATIVIGEMFSQHYPNCGCRQEGDMEIFGTISDCLTCAKHLTSFDGHANLNDYAAASIVWLAQMWQGKMTAYYKRIL